jgi:hypothetical protein
MPFELEDGSALDNLYPIYPTVGVRFAMRDGHKQWRRKSGRKNGTGRRPSYRPAPAPTEQKATLVHGFEISSEPYNST